MENNTLLTGLQELFTNAIKAEMAKHVEANGNGTAIDKDKVHEAVAVALSNQDSDTYPCMDDVTRMVEHNFDEWFNNCMQSYDITDHVDLDDLVQSAVNDIDLSEAITDTMYNGDYPNESRVEEMIEESSSTGMSLYDANEMLKQVARGGDCEDGNSFREAVLAIVNADKLKNGVSVDDGTHMSVKANGTDREIQAILTRRKSYFESLHSALALLLGSAPNGEVPPIDDGTALEAWKTTMYDRRPINGSRVTLDRLWAVAKSSTELLGLLSGLYHGKSGEESMRVSQAWQQVFDRAKSAATTEDANA